MTDKWVPIREFDYPTTWGDPRERDFMLYDNNHNSTYIGNCSYDDSMWEYGEPTFMSNSWHVFPTHFMEIPKPPVGDSNDS